MEKNEPDKINQRIPVWIALSQFYLDTDLSDEDLMDIFKVISENNYSIEDAKKIDFFELRPILKWNLRAIACVWTAFDEDWLIETVKKKFKGDSIFSKKLTGLKYRWYKGLTDRYWNKIENLSNKYILK